MDFRPAKDNRAATELWDGDQQIATIYALALGVVVTTEGPWNPGPIAVDVQPAQTVHILIRRNQP